MSAPTNNIQSIRNRLARGEPVSLADMMRVNQANQRTPVRANPPNGNIVQPSQPVQGAPVARQLFPPNNNSNNEREEREGGAKKKKRTTKKRTTKKRTTTKKKRTTRK